MAFSGFGGFGQNNNTQQPQGSGFGGFGSNNTTGSAFGQPQTTAFGVTPATGNAPFGTNSGGTGGFGSGGFGLGTNNNTAVSAFGANKPAFGSTPSSGPLFGSVNTTTGGPSTGFGGGGFGTTNNANSSFGTTGGSLFGSSNSGNPFGSGTQTSNLFGAPQSTALSTTTISSADCQGTASTPFQVTTEKEGTTSSTNNFHSISFMQPYKNFSFEELRLADYNQGRRFGNGNNQVGAFGMGTGFGGGFAQSTSNSGGGLFGPTTSTPAASFGPTPTASGIFGGPAKPAAGGLFGPTSTSQTSGGLFSTTNTQSGFGTGTGTGFTNNSTTGSNLFANNTNNNQAKPGMFGTGTTSGFGVNTGASTGTGLFATGQQNQQNNTNPFGQANQNQTTTTSGFGGFGPNQTQKPGGIFGTSTNTSGSLFGTNNQTAQQPATTSIFGNPNTNNNNSGSLFGPKPATSGTGTGLFNNNNTAASNPFPAFGNNTQNQSSSIFGSSQQQSKPGSLFSGANASTTGTNLFQNATNTQQPSSTSIFGNLGTNNQNQQQSQPSNIFGTANGSTSDVFGNSQPQQQNQLAAPAVLNTSLRDETPWGSASIFLGLPAPPQTNGPIATPISAGQKLKKSAILPQYKINPHAASRLLTPQRRGYGFSYSTYGTPSSISSNTSTPGFLSNSLIGGSMSRGLGKSLSTSSLRRTFENDGESVLSPGAFSAGSSRYSGSGSLKRLTIDRSLRTDLFSKQGATALPGSDNNDQSRQSSILKKKVSFDASTVGGNANSTNRSQVNGNSQDNDNATPSAEEQGLLRSSSRKTNGQGGKTSGNSGTTAPPDGEHSKGKELAVVHEDGSPENSGPSTFRSTERPTQRDPIAGEYYCKPSIEELKKMSRQQLQRVENFILGREGCGEVVFNQPVDMTSVDLDRLFGTICVITLRSLSLYPNWSAQEKPPEGKALNVPATITLYNSWPRARNGRDPLYEKSGPRYEKHVQRLRRIGGTEFISYNKDNGEFKFKVPHFSTYAVNYEDEDSEGDNLDTSTMSAPPDTPTPKTRPSKGGYTPMPAYSPQDTSMLTDESSQVSSAPDDTFEFKRRKLLPGAFDDVSALEDDHEMEDNERHGNSFLDRHSVMPQATDDATELSVMNDGCDDGRSHSSHAHDRDARMAGAYPLPNDEEGPRTTEDTKNLKSILKNTQRHDSCFGTPGRPKLDPRGDWAEQLQQTISPRKQDRRALRESQARIMKNRAAEREETPTKKLDADNGGKMFLTSIDLMKSIFGKEEARKSGRGARQDGKGNGFQWPYTKKPTVDDANSDMSGSDREFHDSYKPSWGPNGTLLYARPSSLGLTTNRGSQTDAIMNDQKQVIVSEGRDIRFARLATASDLTPAPLIKQKERSNIDLIDGIPFARTQPIAMSEVFETVRQNNSLFERFVWRLAMVLFDDYADDFTVNLSDSQRAEFADRIRKDRLSSYWERLCNEDVKKMTGKGPANAEERAIIYLTAHKITEACEALLEGKDFRLAILLAQVGGDRVMREDMATQLKEWRRLNVLSEMIEPIRALYELLSGNTGYCEGKKGPVEDRAQDFTISERFNLNWKQAFGLRLWYGILPEDPIEDSIQKFSDDLRHHETKKPIPHFIENKKASLWNDHDQDKREDLLWGLLKLYASSKGTLPLPTLADIVMPENTNGNPLNVRLSFQLYHILSTRFPQQGGAKSDQLTWDFAAQLDSAGEWLWAVFALLHLSNTAQRQQALQSIIAHHADQLLTADSPAFATLVKDYKIPSSWIWEAAALYARSVLQDHIREVDLLLKACNWNEAHTTFCRLVAPKAIIEQDWSTLKTLLEGFGKAKEMVNDWPKGGGMYEDFARLIDGTVKGTERRALLRRLVNHLEGVRMEGVGFEERVALGEMSAVVGGIVSEGKEKGVEAARVLQLPLTEDKILQHTIELSLGYYKAVMAGGG